VKRTKWTISAKVKDVKSEENARQLAVNVELIGCYRLPSAGVYVRRCRSVVRDLYRLDDEDDSDDDHEHVMMMMAFTRCEGRRLGRRLIIDS